MWADDIGDGGGGVVVIGVWVGFVRNERREEACVVFSELNIRSRWF